MSGILLAVVALGIGSAIGALIIVRRMFPRCGAQLVYVETARAGDCQGERAGVSPEPQWMVVCSGGRQPCERCPMLQSFLKGAEILNSGRQQQ